MLLISGPSMVITYFKLRKRNLAPILDANGWAVNTRAIVNIPFGKTLTALARLPEGAQSSLVDPFAEKERPWKLYLFLVAVAAVALLLWQKGCVSEWWKEMCSQAADYSGAQGVTTACACDTASASTSACASQSPIINNPGDCHCILRMASSRRSGG